MFEIESGPIELTEPVESHPRPERYLRQITGAPVSPLHGLEYRQRLAIPGELIERHATMELCIRHQLGKWIGPEKLVVCFESEREIAPGEAGLRLVEELPFSGQAETGGRYQDQRRGGKPLPHVEQRYLLARLSSTQRCDLTATGAPRGREPLAHRCENRSATSMRVRWA